MNFNIEFFVGLYRALGRDQCRRALTIPGGPLVAQANKNKDEPDEIIRKRDALAESALALIEEYANLDND